MSSSISSSSNSRPNRTKFTDMQIRSLNQMFKQQRYPKDEQVARLAKQLHLKQRVITVWFQNARQKCRKSNHQTSGSTHAAANNSFDYLDQDMDEETNNNNNNDDDDGDDNDAENEGDDEAEANDDDADDNHYYNNDDYYYEDENQSHVSSSDSVASDLKTSATAPPKSDEAIAASQLSQAQAASAKALQLAFSILAAHQSGTTATNLMSSMLPNVTTTTTTTATAAVNAQPIETAAYEDLDDDSDDNELADEMDDEDNDSLSNSNKNFSANGGGAGGQLQKAMAAAVAAASASSNASKRLRTTILPEQQEYLMQKYQMDQNPSRKMLDEIAREVSLGWVF